LIIPQRAVKEIVNIFGENKGELKIYFSPNQVMFESLQLICFEVVKECNLAEVHKFCPAILEDRHKSRVPATNEEFISFLEFCISNRFKGKVAFHWYNEPTLDLERCRELSKEVNRLGLKTLLWTNGSCEEDLSFFDEVFITEYEETGECTKKIEFQPDDRIKIYDTEIDEDKKLYPCYRLSHIELPIDYFGDIHICCSDWRGEIEIGNIITDNFEFILANWKDITKRVSNSDIDLCKKCQTLKNSPAVIDKNLIV